VRERLALAAVLAGSLTFLVSLYFDWLNAASCIGGRCFDTHNPDVALDGWSGGFGQIAAVLAIALASAAIAAIFNKELATRFPLGRLTVALGLFALLSLSALWTAAIANSSFEELTIGLRPGAYIGIAGAAVACAGAAAARWRELARPQSVTGVAGQLITLALIASFVLPALNASSDATREDLTTFICMFACLGLLAWQGRRPGPRLATAAAIGTLVAGGLLPLRHGSERWPYELWLQLACTAGLLLLCLVGSPGVRIRRARVGEIAIVVGSVVLLGSMFLPWRSVCDGSSCYSQRGWSTAQLAGVFALGLLVALVWIGRFVREFAIGAAILVLSIGFATATSSWSQDYLNPRRGRPAYHSVIGFHFIYGAPVGFAGAALLLVFGLGRFRPILDRRFFVRLVPVLAALALVAFALAPGFVDLLDILGRSDRFGLKSPFLTLGLLGGITLLLALRLVFRWFDGPEDDAEVVRLPLALLALTALAVIHDAIVTTNSILGDIYGKGISWEGWVALFLCLLLVACGWVERYGGGLERFRVHKEIWRVDPLPPVEN